VGELGGWNNKSGAGNPSTFSAPRQHHFLCVYFAAGENIEKASLPFQIWAPASESESLLSGRALPFKGLLRLILTQKHGIGQ
jgi:hypothetical protein